MRPEKLIALLRQFLLSPKNAASLQALRELENASRKNQDVARIEAVESLWSIKRTLSILENQIDSAAKIVETHKKA